MVNQGHTMVIVRGDVSNNLKSQCKFKYGEWSLPDIVDLEYFLEQDRKMQGEDALKKRDRAFYLDRIRPNMPNMDLSVSQDRVDGKAVQSLGKQAILQWLGLRRAEQEQVLLPGSIYRETSSLMVWVFFLGGVFLGTSVVASFFSYSGTRPLNVSYYLSLTLLGQLILLTLSMAGLVVAGTGRVSPPMPVFQRLFGLLVHRMMGKIREKSIKHIARGHQEAMAHALGLVRAKHRIYGPLFLWPLFILGQLFALGFNAGVLVTTLARVFFSDTAFGWQSTLQVGPDLVHGLVSVVALPWSWLFPPGVAFPTLEAIAGSRMILKDGIYHLTTGDLVSWWPFLCLCVFFYGLLPRLLLVGVGHWMKIRCIAGLTFDHAPCQRLLTRMTTPLVSIDGSLSSPTAPSPMGNISPCPGPSMPSDDAIPASGFIAGSVNKSSDPQGHLEPVEHQMPELVQKGDRALMGEEEIKKEADNTHQVSQEFPPSSSPDPLQQFRRSLVLVSDDLAEVVDDNELARQVLTHCGTTLVGRITVGMNSDRELKIIDNICNTIPGQATFRSSISPISSIVWVLEAWQPPIKETLFFLRELRRVTGDGMDIIVGLVGKPSAHTVFTPPGAMDLSVWHKKLEGLGDPWLRIESLEVLS